MSEWRPQLGLPFGQTQLRPCRGASPLHRGPEAPYFPSHLTYPNIKRDTHGNSKGMNSYGRRRCGQTQGEGDVDSFLLAGCIPSCCWFCKHAISHSPTCLVFHDIVKLMLGFGPAGQNLTSLNNVVECCTDKQCRCHYMHWCVDAVFKEFIPLELPWVYLFMLG